MPILAASTDASVDAPGLALAFSRSFDEPISQRYDSGPSGYGWSDNWNYSLVTQTDGTVQISVPTAP